MADKARVNIDAYRSSEALERYTSYHLFPIEKYLFQKYYHKGDRILDHACGSGRTTIRLHELGYRPKGIDQSDVLIAAAKIRFPHLSWEQGSYADIREPDASFDHVLISHNGIDYAYPEEERVRAVRECWRVLKDHGTLILSSHNIKSLHVSPYYFLHWRRIPWKIMNSLKAFKDADYVFDLGAWTFFGRPDYVVRQVEREGFRLKEVIGFRMSHNHVFNVYCSPYIHYVFEKPDTRR
jgi:ubiquinone/menaquinone biosynthesis C-methylase UbiE